MAEPIMLLRGLASQSAEPNSCLQLLPRVVLMNTAVLLAALCAFIAANALALNDRRFNWPDYRQDEMSSARVERLPLQNFAAEPKRLSRHM